jgi:hypothetical protein
VNQWSKATAVFGGMAGIALLLLTMNYNHPFTTKTRWSSLRRPNSSFRKVCRRTRAISHVTFRISSTRGGHQCPGIKHSAPVPRYRQAKTIPSG